MRRTKISLKKYFYLTLICALVLIFILNFRDFEVWKTKAPLAAQSHRTQRQQQSHSTHISQSPKTLGDYAEKDDDRLEAKYLNELDGDGPVHSEDGQPENIQQTIPVKSQQSEHQEKNILPSQSINKITDADDDGAADEESIANDAEQQKLTANEKNSKDAQKAAPAKAWFFKDGTEYPKPAGGKKHGQRQLKRPGGNKLFPQQDPTSDRIVNQLMYIPANYDQIRKSGKLKTILLYNGLGPWNIKQGRDVFLRSKCPVDTCEITANRDRANTADMILYKDHYIPTGIRRAAHSLQVNMLYQLECPYHTQNVKVADAINWTATYRRDSDIVAPYEKWQYFDTNVHQMEQERNYAANKTKKVAWFVSNCGARNGRIQFAHELQKYIDVDIYGACGNFKCSRSTADKCFDILDHDYKFYLAFENSNCKDYITEKFFVNSLNRNVLPIVMGARPEDYELSSPHRSYIHVDEFNSAKELAEYLHILDKDDDLYNLYFKWKGTGEFINTYFWCRVCSTLHDEESLKTPRWHDDINDWWRGPGICTNGSWRNYKARKDITTDD